MSFQIQSRTGKECLSFQYEVVNVNFSFLDLTPELNINLI